MVKLERYLHILIGALSFIVLIFVATCGYITDSEIWAITLSQKLGSHTENISLFYKYLFYALLKIPYFFSVSNWTHILISRLEFSLLGVGVLLVFWRIQKLCYERNFALLMVSFLASSYAFLTHFTRVRSDYLATFFYLFFVYSVIVHFKKKNLIYLGFGWVSLLGAFLSTPKAALLIISGILGYVFSRGPLEARKSLRTVGLLFLTLVVAAHGVDFFLAENEFFISLKSAISYATESFVSSYRDYDFFVDFQHVGRFLKNNILQGLVIMISMGALLTPQIRKRFDQTGKFLSIQFYILIVLALIYNQKYSFFLASLLPIMLLVSGLYLQRWKSLKEARFRIFLLVVFLLLQVNVFYKNYKYIRNKDQKSMISYLDDVVRNRSLKIYDVIGLLPRNNHYFAFLNEGDPANIYSLEKIIRDPPDLIVNVAKVSLSPEIYEYMIRNYRDVGGGLYSRVYRWSDFGSSCKASYRGVADALLRSRLEDTQYIEILKEPFWPRSEVIGVVGTMNENDSVDLCGEPAKVLSLSPLHTEFNKNADAIFSFDAIN